MYVHEFRIDPVRFRRFAVERGYMRGSLDDPGYAAHVLFVDQYGERRPPVFRFFRDDRIFAYSEHDETAYRTVPGEILQYVQGRAVPDFPTGARAYFDLLAVPSKRLVGVKREIDAFVHALRTAGETGAVVDREDVYRAWLAERIAGLAEPERVELVDFRIVSAYRSPHDRGTKRWITVPRAVMRGVIRIVDPAGLRERMLRGIGRHRRFGFGMMILRPMDG